MAQQARPNCAGQIADCRAHLHDLLDRARQDRQLGIEPVRVVCLCHAACRSLSRPRPPAAPAAAGCAPRTARAPGPSRARPCATRRRSRRAGSRKKVRIWTIARPSQVAQRHRPRIEERDLDVEEQEDHRHQVELHRVAFPGVAHGRHAALVGRQLLGGRVLGAEEQRQPDHGGGESDAEHRHDHDAEPTVQDHRCENFPKPVHAIERHLKGQCTRPPEGRPIKRCQDEAKRSGASPRMIAG